MACGPSAPEQLRLNQKAVEKFLQASGHDLCHENRAELAAHFGLSNLVPVPPKTVEEFDAGCKKYQLKIFGKQASLKDQLDALTDEERDALFSNYCRHCGSKDSGCQCWNDE